nr:MAG TPA: hypothetical protein [Caudoviricetes sp.]
MRDYGCAERTVQNRKGSCANSSPETERIAKNKTITRFNPVLVRQQLDIELVRW